MPEADVGTFMLYCNSSAPTGRKLAEEIGVDDHGKECSKRVDWLIRWGTTKGVRFIPEQGVINSKSSLEDNVNKLRSLRLMKEAGVPVPNFSTDPENLCFPMLGRSTRHSQGSDINLLLQPRDVFLTDNDFYVEYLPTKLEYRFHVICGELVKVHEKRLRREEDNHPYIRNAETGWVFCNPDSELPDRRIANDALDALDMDFGALDIIKLDKEALDRGYSGTETPDLDAGHDSLVLEVNSAPSLDENNLQRYVERFEDVIENRTM